MLKNVVLGLLAAQSAASMRFAMYIDEYVFLSKALANHPSHSSYRYHTTDLPGTNQTQEIDHAIMAFAPTKIFNSDSPPSFQPFESPETMRSRFSPNTKLMIAIGGWGDTAGFSAGAKDDTTRARFAKNVASMLDANGFDGVGKSHSTNYHAPYSSHTTTDIDWEYPGGNGQDYKQIPNSDKVSEIQTYPMFLAAVKKAIGNKTLSIAVPGRKQDMIAFTKEQGPKIFESVDMINVMAYDLMNRRDNVTSHTTSVEGSLDTINNYLAIGADPAKLNLGFPYYAKWFTTDPNSDCDTHPLGCKVVKLENDDGTDNGKSGALTFETKNMAPPPANLTTSTNGKCGYSEAAKCPDGSCCSAYGNW